MERHLPLWIFSLLMNGINGQESMDNALDIEYEMVDQPAFIEQNDTKCTDSVHTYLANTTRALFLNEIMPEIEEILARKDQVIVQLDNSINEVKVRIRSYN